MVPDSQNDSVINGAAAIVHRLADRQGIIVGWVQQLLVAEIAELRDDAQLLQLFYASTEANIETVFSAIRYGIPVENVQPPTAALEHARRLAQRDVSVNVLMRAYRLGQKAVLEMAREEVRAANFDSQLSLDIFGQIAEVTFGYVDWISQEVVGTYQSEHDRWTENRNSMRGLRVREVLDSGDIDVDMVTTEIRYPLNQLHLAAVLWYGEPTMGGEFGGLEGMERFAQQLGHAVGASANPMLIPVDRLTGWMWIPLLTGAAADALAALRVFIEARAEAPWIAVGDPLPHVDGFRRSHRQAREAHAMAIALGANAQRVTAASDPGLSMAALLGGDIEAAADWVDRVLGPLASRTENDERLRETLRVFLRTGSSFKAAAEELHLHYNSIKYRVQRAVHRRGRPITDDRLDVEVALALCRWYGTAVLR